MDQCLACPSDIILGGSGGLVEEVDDDEGELDVGGEHLGREICQGLGLVQDGGYRMRGVSSWSCRELQSQPVVQ